MSAINSATVLDTLWTGATGKEARKDKPIVFQMMVYLITGPEKNPYGLFVLEPAVLAIRLGGAERDFTYALDRLARLGFCRWDASTGWVWVIEMAHYQFAAPLKEADYRCRAIKKWYRTAPRNVFLGPWFDRYARDFHLAVDPDAVQRRDHQPFSQQAPTNAPLEAPGVKPLSTDQDLGFDLSSQKIEEQTSLLPVDPATVPMSTAVAEAAFEQLWAIYPNGKQKKDAKELFLKLKPTPAFVSTVAASIEAHKLTHEWMKSAGQFVPRMVNWLKAEGWNDRPATSAPVLSERTSKNLAASRGFLDRIAGSPEGDR